MVLLVSQDRLEIQDSLDFLGVTEQQETLAYQVLKEILVPKAHEVQMGFLAPLAHLEIVDNPVLQGYQVLLDRLDLTVQVDSREDKEIRVGQALQAHKVLRAYQETQDLLEHLASEVTQDRQALEVLMVFRVIQAHKVSLEPPDKMDQQAFRDSQALKVSLDSQEVQVLQVILAHLDLLAFQVR